MFGLALPDAASRNEFHILASASWTDNTIRPALRHKVIQAVVGVAVEDDCGLQGLRLFHSKTRVPEKGYCVKYINAGSPKGHPIPSPIQLAEGRPFN
jgi:hypothetical protein